MMKRELSKLLREQQDAIDNRSDPAFDKWWVKQVAKARNLNIIRQILMWTAIGAVAIFFIVEDIHVKNDIKNMTDEQYEQYTQQVDPPDYIESDP